MAASMGGYLGLTHNVGKREAAAREIDTLSQLYNFKKQTEQEEAQAELAYQETLSKVKDQSANLLENDRIAINSKAKELQNQLREKVKALGGSKKAFLKSGGLSDLSNYRDNILYSDEMQMYKSNKINMEKILMIKEKKMGHLLNERDANALRNYEKNGGGEISYTGLLNEIEVDETLFEWGKQITPEDVLNAGDNRYAIIANYESDTGKKYNPSYEDRDLKAYIKYKGYGGLGKNVEIIKQRNAQRKAQKKAEQEKQGKMHSVGVILGRTMNKPHMTYEDRTFNNLIGSNTGSDINLGMEENKKVSYVPPSYDAAHIPTSYLKGKALEVFRTGYKLKGSARITKGKEAELMQSYLGEIQPDESGSYAIDPTTMQGTYDAMGEPLTNKSTIRSWENNYKPMEIIIGGKTNINGSDRLVVEAYKNGKYSEEENAELYGDEKPKATKNTLLVRMHDKKNPGFDFYQEIDATSTIGQKMLGDLYGDDNDLSKISQEQIEYEDKVQKQIPQAVNDISDNKKLEQSIDTDVQRAVKAAPKSETLTSDYFDLLTSKFDSGGLNRSALVRSFYQANSKGDENKLVSSADNKMFDLALEEYELNSFISDNNISDEDFIQKFYEADNKTENPEAAYYFAQTWKRIYENNINPDKQ